jgi:ribonuclease HII
MKTYKVYNRLEAGIDEAGRGPLFGRVYAAAVILNPTIEYDYNLIKDSKKLSSKKILESEQYVKDNAIAWSVSFQTEKRIEQINILHATQEAMHEAVAGLSVKPEYLLVDGNYFKPYNIIILPDYNTYSIPHECVVKGDATYGSIAAASILAKTARDRYIKDLCSENPDLQQKYGIYNNKGYGAKIHIEGIKEYGITKWHRKSFGICKEYS